MNRFTFFAVALAFPMLASCSDSATTVDPLPVLDALATTAILPAYEDFSGSCTDLAQSAQVFAEGPTAESLGRFREAWRRARLAYRRLDAVYFGPAEDAQLAETVNDSATNGPAIEAFLASAEPVTSDSVARLGTNKSGFFALEYVLFEPSRDVAEAGTGPNPPVPDADVIAKFALPSGQRRGAFVAIVAQRIADAAKGVNQQWRTYGAMYKKPGNALFPSAKTAVDRTVSALAAALETNVKVDLGTPVGRYSNGQVQPTSIKTVRSDHAIAELRASFQAATSLYEGNAGSPGISALVRGKSTAVDDRFRTASTTAASALAALRSPFAESLAAPANVTAAYEAVNATKRVVATDVASVLGVTLALNPNDGD